MNSHDIFNAMGSIDEDLVARAENSKKSKKSTVSKRVIPLALCLAIAFAAVFGFFKNGSPGVTAPTATQDVSAPRFGLLVASAVEKDVTFRQIKNEYNVRVPYECRFMLEHVDGMTTEQKNEVFDKLKEINKEYIEREDRDIPSYGAEIHLSDETENSIYAVYSLAYFSFAVENAELLDRIVISGTGNYSFTKHTSDSCTVGADEGRELTISGDEYRKNNTVGISWNPAYETIAAFESDAQMTVSDITDTLIFTAFFKDGKTEQIRVDISFDDNGIMNTVVK